MKKLVFTLVVAFMAIISADAQVYVGGSFNLTHDKNADVTNFSIAPEVGYNLNENWAISNRTRTKLMRLILLLMPAFHSSKKVLSVYSWTVVLVSLPIKEKATIASTVSKSVSSRVLHLKYART